MTARGRAMGRREFLQAVGAGAAGCLLSGCSALQKMDRGLYDVHRGVTQEDMITGQRVPGFHTRSEQISRGNAAMERIVRDYRRLNEQVNRREYSRLKEIFQRVHRVSHYAQEDWRILLLPDDDFNAFVTGGTYVAVNEGLMTRVHDDSAVAAVVGHEIGHVTANHLFDRQDSLILLSEAILGNSPRPGASYAYSALNETEADKIGVVYSALAGYDPNAVSALWERMAQRHGDDWSWFRTHPASSDRARATRTMARQAREYYVPGRMNPNHRRLARCNRFWCNEARG